LEFVEKRVLSMSFFDRVAKNASVVAEGGTLQAPMPWVEK
jgi:hypothetical protein